VSAVFFDFLSLSAFFFVRRRSLQIALFPRLFAGAAPGSPSACESEPAKGRLACGTSLQSPRSNFLQNKKAEASVLQPTPGKRRSRSATARAKIRSPCRSAC